MDQELELIRIALKERQADAFERVERCRRKMVDDLAALKELELSARDPRRKRTQAYIDDLAKKLHAKALPILDRLTILEEMVKQLGKSTMDRLGGATAEQILMNEGMRGLLDSVGRRRIGDPLVRLLVTKRLEIEHVMHGREIARVLEHITHRSHAKIANYPVATELDPEGRSKRERMEDAIDYAEYMAIVHAKVYMPWADKQREIGTLPLVVGLCVEGRSIEELRRAYRLNWDTVMKHIKEALDSYASFRERWFRGAPEPRNPGVGSDLALRVH